jgi:hypothetical protein
MNLGNINHLTNLPSQTDCVNEGQCFTTDEHGWTRIDAGKFQAHNRCMAMQSESTPIMKKVDNPKRNHHVLPKLYLKGFVVKKDEPFVWVYQRGQPYNPGSNRYNHRDKIEKNPYVDTITNAGAELDFFADPQKDGSKDFETFENILESLEKPANAIFDKLRAHQVIDREEKYIFSRYIVLMQRRVWAGREQVKELLPEIIAGSKPSREYLEKTKLPNTPKLQAKWKIEVEKLSSQPDHHIKVHNHLAAIAPNSFMVLALQEMTWTFYVASNPCAFFTGDNPVFVPKNNGLGKNNSELSFPISNDVVLNASWDRKRKEGFEEAKSQIVKEINHRTISQSSKIYFSQNQEWVVTMLDKGNLGGTRSILRDRFTQLLNL